MSGEAVPATREERVWFEFFQKLQANGVIPRQPNSASMSWEFEAEEAERAAWWESMSRLAEREQDHGLILEEAAGDSEAWARSEEDGWFYSDGDGT